MNDTSRKAAGGDDFSEYVAHLQLHMALQARNLVPRMNSTSISDSRDQLLQSTQADFEKIASRQLHSSNV